MVIYVTHNKGITMTFKGHTVFMIYISLIHSRSALYRMAPQPRVPEIGIEKRYGLIYFSLYCLWELGVLFDEPICELNRHYSLLLPVFSCLFPVCL